MGGILENGRYVGWHSGHIYLVLLKSLILFLNYGGAGKGVNKVGVIWI